MIRVRGKYHRQKASFYDYKRVVDEAKKFVNGAKSDAGL